MKMQSSLTASAYRNGISKESRKYRENKIENIFHIKTKPVMIVKQGTCRCKYPGCGAYLDVLTHVHAEKHGYKDKYEMIAAGMVEYL